VVVTPGGTGGKSIVAHNRLTGAPLWKSLNDRAAYTSPILATLAGRRQIVWISAERTVGIGVADGKLLWEYPWPKQMDMNCSQPVVIDETDVLLKFGARSWRGASENCERWRCVDRAAGVEE
jgi:outer membrane protein assembly factor BamB